MLPAGAGVLERVGGGDINEAFRVRLADGREAFVKTREQAAEGEYAAEAAGLRWLAQPGALRTPAVLEIHERYLALEWVPRGHLSERGAIELGVGLADTHLAGAEAFGAPAADGAGARFGSLGLSNERTEDWASFYVRRRLEPLARMARERGVLASSAVAAVGRVCERMEELAGPAEEPARLHGDLWSGNVMADSDGRPWLIDPSAYGGHREMDLAMLRLFGSPSRLMFDAYEERAPLAEGWQERVELFQLAPLLVHALLFGGSYREAVASIATRYAG